MKIEVRLFGYFCHLLGNEENRYFFGMDIGNEPTCADLLAILNIPSNFIKIILVNGVVQNETYVLKERDQVSILPFIEGG
jgi:sulfur carrier protein ThiS